MKHTTLITTVVVSLTLGLSGLGGPVSCSCTGNEAGLSPQLVEPGDSENEQEPEIVQATASTTPRPQPIQVVEEEDEHPLPVDDEREDEGEEAPQGSELSAENEAENDGESESEETEPAEVAREYPLQAVAYQFVTDVVAEPAPRALVIGYLRRGARVRVDARVRGRGCQRGWHEVEGGGYVCHGGGVVVGENPDDWPDAPAPPTLDRPLPYSYLGAVRDYVPEYREIPSQEQESQAKAATRALHDATETPAASESESESGGEAEEVNPAGEVDTSDAPEKAAENDGAESEEAQLPEHVRMLLYRGFIVSSTHSRGRWLRTVRGRYVEKTVLSERESPDFHGVELGEELTLPIAFVTRGRAKALRPRVGQALRFEVAGTLRRLSPLPVLGEVVRGEQRYISIGKRLLARSNVLAIAEPVERPPHVGPEERWIDVDLSSQVLLAYEGDTPVFATLVSTGRSADGFATPTGSFRIRTKHVTTTMDDPDGGSEAYSIEDVPWTMYFHESYALHGAFWHNQFGQERSHGCVNLSPTDARWLFFWAGPALPPGWHGIRSSRERPGTVVIIHE